MSVYERKSYEPPKLRCLGNMADVTLKSGAIPDLNQITKPGTGQG